MDYNAYIQEYANLLFSNEQESHTALNYLKINRGLSENIIKFLEIGYCGHKSEVPGITKEEKYLNRMLNGKIVVPIKSDCDEFLAFASRSPSAEIKGDWWNQTFEKNNNLFLLNKSRDDVINSSKIYIVEGYFDAITLYQFGIKNVCALMGVALGHRKIGILARYCDKICLCYDTDEKNKNTQVAAGQLARARAINELYQYGWKDISAISVPLGIDPDEFIINNGKDRFLALERKLTQEDIIRVASKYRKYTGK